MFWVFPIIDIWNLRKLFWRTTMANISTINCYVSVINWMNFFWVIYFKYATTNCELWLYLLNGSLCHTYSIFLVFNEVLHLSDSRILSWKNTIGLIFSKHHSLSFEKCVSLIWAYKLSNDGSTSGPALLWSLFNWITCQLCIFLKSYFELFLYLHIMNNATNTANTWMNFLVFILLLQLNIGFL